MPVPHADERLELLPVRIERGRFNELLDQKGFFYEAQLLFLSR